jgi:ketosteroid isomerase-like protein
MSDQDLTVLRTGYDAFNRGDMPAVLELFDPEIDWYEPGGGRAPKGHFHGAQTVVNDVFSAVPENFEHFEAQPERFIDSDGWVVVIGTFRGRPKAGGEFEAPFAHVWHMRDGKALTMANHVEAAPWRQAWGAG